jgi:dnaB-like helicase C terminal domain
VKKYRKEVNMEESKVKKIYEILNNIPVTEKNKDLIEEIREKLLNKEYIEALSKIEELNNLKEDEEDLDETDEEETEEQNGIYPKKLSNIKLEHIYMGMLLNDPKQIVKYYFKFEECYFEDPAVLNAYKSVLFTEGGAYSSEEAKANFNFARDNEESYKFKMQLKEEMANKNYNMEKVYISLKKLFVLRKSYLAIPIKSIQDKVVEITQYILYDKMSVEEVESAIQQVNDTEKFKRSVLTSDLTSFLEMGDNNLRNGLPLPFPIMTKVFKGIRKGETMAIAMPSNSGKSRITIDIAAHIALVHKKKTLIISNEMSEEKMRLCLITTMINNKAIQEMHGQKGLKITEGELLEFKFRPDDPKSTDVDEDGYITRHDGEKQGDFVKRLLKESSDFKRTVAVTDWANKEIGNSIYFINITDHTNDELKKVIMNYYYKEQIEYVFYDTLKTDIANIGNGEEVKKTATILSNLAQNFDMYICSTLQLAESNTLPVNLNVNDLSASRTVKEVLDTLSLMKQINRDTLQNYEYSLEEVDTKFYDLKKEKDPDVRYYACVIDKNRAGAKPTLVFKINLAYNIWEELGYLRLKQGKEEN